MTQLTSSGSSDNTVKLLKEKGVKVKRKVINPWRFDVARNESIKLIPKDTDICVCTDLDEVFNKGWRKELESVWKKDTNKCRYIYNWSLDEFNKPIVSFYYEKIHSLGYKWINPVHEVLNNFSNEKIVTSDKIVLNHYPDSSKSRSNYLPLLELSVKENPNNDRNMHYLGREYMYYGKWNECIDTLIKHLNMKTATWKDERSASMRFIARSYKNLFRYEEAIMWLNKAIEEAPYLRDPYVEMALLDYDLNKYDDVEYYSKKALEIELNERSYINEVFTFDETVYDLLSVVSFYKKNYDDSLMYVNKALEINPNNERIKNNKKIIEEFLAN